MAVQAAKVSVGTTATSLNAVESHAYASDHVSLGIKVPTGGSTVYVGGEDVDTTDGFPVAAGESLTFNEIGLGEVAFAVVASGTQDVNVIRHGVG